MKLLVSIAVLVALLSGCASVPSQADIANADYGSYPSNYESIVKGFYENRLKDPSSVQYRTITAPRKFYLGSRFSSAEYGYLVCATYNAKNGFGAYTGFDTDGFLLRNGAVAKYLENGQWFAQQMC